MEKQYPIKNNLDCWLSKQKKESFPFHYDYFSRFNAISDYLKANIYPDIAIGAIIEELKKGNISSEQVIHLTKHGEGHTDKVVEISSDILKKTKCKLTPYEGYILLTAIYFHDTGNIYGRKEHEKKCAKIMIHLGSAAGEDRVEKNVIVKIASSHGGFANGDKDTINKLLKNCDILGKRVRKRFLAGILRFADELADDRSRASRYLLNNKLIDGSEIYHAYSNSLHSVIAEEKEISLSFEITKEKALKIYTKDNEETFLLDEILYRTLKMHKERVYCMRFLRPEIDIQKISVKIEVFDDIRSDTFTETIEKIEFCLEEQGYPEMPSDDIAILCPDLKDRNGIWLKKQIENKTGKIEHG